MKHALLFLSLMLTSVSSHSTSYDLEDEDNDYLKSIYPGFTALLSMSFDDGRDDFDMSFGRISASALVLEEGHDDNLVLAASISISTGGEQRLYIEQYNLSCDKRGKDMTKGAIKANNKNIKVISFCNGEYYSLTPQTNVGHDYLVNLFKTEEWVFISSYGYDIAISAQGFTRSWDEAGGDAI